MPRVVEVVRTYLEMNPPDAFKPSSAAVAGARIEPCIDPPASFLRYLYQAVGGPYYWLDRLPWSDEEWLKLRDDPQVAFHVLYYQGWPAGYVELIHQPEAVTQISYFGLVQAAHGRGLGRLLLDFSVRHSFERGSGRVWLHTCTLDGEAALPNYQARGFVPYRQETYHTTLPD